MRIYHAFFFVIFCRPLVTLEGFASATNLRRGAVETETNMGKALVNVTRVQSGQGKICWAMYNNAAAFASALKTISMDEAYRSNCEPIEEQATSNQFVANFEIPQLSFGSYALIVFHDKDANNEFNTFPFLNYRIPLEDYGFANNPVIRTPDPPFEDCSFELENTTIRIGITMNRGFNV